MDALYRRVVHPPWPDLYFVGFFNVSGGAYISVMEVEPQWVAALVSGRTGLHGLLSAAGVPDLDPETKAALRQALAVGRGGMTSAGARRLVRVAVGHPQVRLVVSALGTPPAVMVAELRRRDIVVGAMCGKAAHARRQVAAGAAVIVAQGTEAGGHTGDISTMVLVPEVVAAAGAEAAVLAAGGITHGSQVAAALAMGAQGLWCGTIWLGTTESELSPFEKEVIFSTPSDGTVRRKARTGKAVRMIRSDLSEAWERPGAPPYLPTPLQGILYNEAHERVVRAGRRDLCSVPAGQSVGALRRETTVRETMYALQLECGEAIERLAALGAGGT